MQRRLPSLEVVVVEGAGHSVQSDRPLELAAHIDRPSSPTGRPPLSTATRRWRFDSRVIWSSFQAAPGKRAAG